MRKSGSKNIVNTIIALSHINTNVISNIYANLYINSGMLCVFVCVVLIRRGSERKMTVKPSVVQCVNGETFPRFQNMLENEFIIISHTYHKRHFNDTQCSCFEHFPGRLMCMRVFFSFGAWTLPFCALNKLPNWNHFFVCTMSLQGYRFGFCLMSLCWIASKRYYERLRIQHALDWNVEHLWAKSRRKKQAYSPLNVSVNVVGCFSRAVGMQLTLSAICEADA